jgi:predicted dienelactone hydrolase
MQFLWLALGLVACSETDKQEDTADVDSVEDTDDTGGGGDPDIWYPADQPGPYQAGTAELSFVGQTGVEITVQVWYPTTENTTMLHLYDGLYMDTALDTPTPDCSETRPVFAFSHGNQGVRWQSTFLTERLATHGFVVIAPGHTGNTTFDYSAERMPEMVFRRPLDIKDSIDWLFDVGGHDAGLTDCLDESQGYAVGGHSLGGYTASAVGGAGFDYEASVAYCEDTGGWLCDEFQAWIAEHPEAATAQFGDERVWASIPLAPAGFEVLGAGAASAEIPFMVLGGERDNSTPMATQVRPIYEALGSEVKYLGMLKDAGHMIFSMDFELTNFDECEEPYLSYELGQPEIQTAVTAFLQLVLGNPDAADYFPTDSDLWEWEG